jgi:hypothetical protein
MRIAAALLTGFSLLVGLAAPAMDDAQVKSLIKYYKKQSSVCAKYASGITSAKERAEPYVDEAEIAADVTKLGEELAVVRDYCDAIDATLAILDPSASYKSLQAEIDKHDSAVRAARAAAKDALEESNDVIQRLIPKVNKRRASS